ncbi:Uncharacterised protein [Mycobacterium tuberculosis]|nr:Uncharacterised protein [Mycobacterium tuberculosis]CNV33350.1 Uncharacterised protein [Mycobacterium tuberculosis]CNZ53324.1 Uncharacterised protein [Mycobacterium tuberculosis]
MIHAVCDGRADGVFGDVAADPVVVGGLATRRVTFQCPAAGFHHVRGLPGAQHHLADTAHRLGIAANHRDCPHIVQHIFCRNGGRSDPAFGKREVLRDPGVEVVAHHQHVEMLVKGVHRMRAGRIGRAGQYIRLRRDGNDVRCVPAAGALGVVGVNRTSGDRADGVLDESGLIESVGVQRNLHPGHVGDRQAGVDGRRGRSPVFVEFETRCATAQLFPQCVGIHGVSLAEQREVHRPTVQ